MDRLNFDLASKLSQEAMKRFAGLPFVQLRIVTDLAQAYPAPESPVKTYAGWTRSFNKRKESNWHLAEMVALNGSAVLRYRDESGKITRRIIQGQDPLQFTVGASEFDLIYIDFFRSFTDFSHVRLYFRTAQRLDDSLGNKLMAVLTQHLPFKRASVYVRRDHWFIEETGFPDFYPFAENAEPPSEAEYHGARTMYCYYGWGNDGCKTTGPSQ